MQCLVQYSAVQYSSVYVGEDEIPGRHPRELSSWPGFHCSGLTPGEVLEVEKEVLEWEEKVVWEKEVVK